MARVVAERGADAHDQVRQVGLHYERIGPQEIVKLFLRQGAGSIRHQGLEELEGLGRQVDRAGGAAKLVRVRVEDEVAERDARHRSPSATCRLASVCEYE